MLNPSVLKYRRRFLFVSFYVFSFQSYDSCYRGGRSNNLLFEGKVLFQGTAEQLAENEIVREKYLGKDFVLRKKDF